MARRYSALQVLDAIEKLRKVKNDPFIACDIICGFPGEDEKAYDETYDLCEKASFSWIHAFPYSPRPGTAAARFSHHVPERIAVERVGRLVRLAETNRDCYIKRQIGRQLEVIIEDNTVESGYAVGITENYLRVLLPLSKNEKLKPGMTVKCTVLSSYCGKEMEDSRIDILAAAEN
jgi:threonylcarbamoyladenosine tRNA methylthiotransferase MtaB